MASSPAYKHTKLSIQSGPYTIACKLYTPTSTTTTPIPIIVLAHGYGALQSMYLSKFAIHFTTELQIASLTFDYRGFGDSTGPEPTEYVNPSEHIKDWHTVITYLHDHPPPGVDEHRVSIWGSSFGGAHVLKVASDDATVECCIAQVPFVGGPESLSMIPLWIQLQGLVYATYDTVMSGILGLVKPYRVPIVAPDGQFALLASPDSYTEFAKMSPTGDMTCYKHHGTTPARALFHTLFYRPLWHAHHIIPKTLIMAAKNDGLIPYWAVERGAKRIFGVEFDNTTLKEHFDPYQKRFDETVAVQTDFLRRKLNL